MNLLWWEGKGTITQRVPLLCKHTRWWLRQRNILSLLNSNSQTHVNVLERIRLRITFSFICWNCNPNCKQYPICELFQGSCNSHTPPSVVLLWIHMESGEAPTSLLQETLKLYHVIALSPGTSYWKGGTVTLMNRVFVTSPLLRLTSLTLEGTEEIHSLTSIHKNLSMLTS